MRYISALTKRPEKIIQLTDGLWKFKKDWCYLSQNKANLTNQIES